MAMDRDYAARFLATSIPKGKIFTVTLQCHDELASQELFELIKSKKHLAGCELLTIFNGDVVAEYQFLQLALKKAVSYELPKSQ